MAFGWHSYSELTAVYFMFLYNWAVGIKGLFQRFRGGSLCGFSGIWTHNLPVSRWISRLLKYHFDSLSYLFFIEKRGYMYKHCSLFSSNKSKFFFKPSHHQDILTWREMHHIHVYMYIICLLYYLLTLLSHIKPVQKAVCCFRVLLVTNTAHDFTRLHQ